MEQLLSVLSPIQLGIAFAIAFSAGLIKGMVGFAMPMIMVSGLSMFLPPDYALAGLILATLSSNIMQAFRQGVREAWNSVKKFRFFLLVGFGFLVAAAQIVPHLSPQTFMLVLGIPVTFFAILQLIGMTWRIEKQTLRSEVSIGIIAGTIGGLSGVWGPPTVLYLTALNTPKAEQVRVQGVIYGLGSLALAGAHFGSGVMRTETLPISIALIPPALLGMWLGLRIQDRIEQKTFRRITLLVLTIAGLNLVRRGLLG